MGEAFHSRRLTLRSSQVGHVSQSQRARWSHGRRLALALALLRDPALDALMTDAAPFDELPGVLAEFNLRNLDEDPAFEGRNTTTEFMARVIFERVCGRIAAGELGAHASGLAGMRVRLNESHVAWAAYEAAL